jgi:hypothetical protein
MSLLLDTFRGFGAWWIDGLSRIGAHLTQSFDVPWVPTTTDAEGDSHSDRSDEAQARLLLAPWWL